VFSPITRCVYLGEILDSKLIPFPHIYDIYLETCSIRQPDQLNPALSQICHPSSTAESDECSAFFGSMAKEMVKPGNCRHELQQVNTVALSVYRGEF
jgi:hypothetical protein